MTHTVLQFDWDEVLGQRFLKCVGINPSPVNNGTVSYESILIYLESGAIHITVSEDTDELFVSKLDLSQTEQLPKLETASIDALKKCEGKELGWCWVGINYRGYKDSFTISFSSVEPQICFVGIASAVKTYLLAAQ